MHTRTPKLLRCIAPAAEDAHGEDSVCGGGLAVAGAEHLVCERCALRYPIWNGVPLLLLRPMLAAATQSQYTRPDTIRRYYDMQYGPFLVRHNAYASKHHPSTPVEGFAALRRERTRDAPHTAAYYDAVNHLVHDPALTEEFYQSILAIAEPYLAPTATVLDLGCGLGRMTGEMARRGAGFALGVDLSARMIEEAAALLGSHGEVAVELNDDNGETVSATLRLDWNLSRYDLVVGDAQVLALRDAAFDLALCLNLLDRVSEPRRVAAELQRIAKLGGHVIISDPGHWDKRVQSAEQHVGDIAALFAPDSWQIVREVDGLPFALPTEARQIIVYMSRCLVLRRMA